MRHIFILNPNAGKRDCTSLMLTKIAQLRADCEISCETMLTTRRGHAEELARYFADSGEEIRLYSCGGDGTLNEVINGAAGYDNVELTVVPIGTGNDFLKNFGEDKARFLDLEQLYDAPSQPLDLIDCNGRLAATVVCAGSDAQVAEDVHKYSGFPLLNGKTSYIASAIVNFGFKNVGHQWTVILDGEEHVGEYIAMCVCNGRYYGGGFMPRADAKMDDGVLNELVIKRMSRIHMLQCAADYTKGDWAKHPEDLIARNSSDVRIRSGVPVVLSVDGEVMHARDVHIKLSEKKMRFFAPLGASCNSTVRVDGDIKLLEGV